MKHLAAYLLLGLGGNTSPSAKDVKDVLSSVGIEADDERLDKLIGELKGKDLQELISEAAGGAAPEAEKKEEKKEEEKEESDEDMGFGLFD
ncbi:MAG: 60S acidic ribosomal protein P2 [Ramalina farinacea]|uniref:60S acidic ribosomal protein P2 n=1 Tax=Ramalina farinacea TaxID=258253 RepID=A0AA43QTE8_9LECA|nr:60S acidic ribosomal protein P2 [Ramalina farinacea]